MTPRLGAIACFTLVGCAGGVDGPADADVVGAETGVGGTDTDVGSADTGVDGTDTDVGTTDVDGSSSDGSDDSSDTGDTGASCADPLDAWPALCVSDLLSEVTAAGFSSPSTLVPKEIERPTCCDGGTIIVDEATPEATRTAIHDAVRSATEIRVIVESSAEGAGAIHLGGASNVDLVLCPTCRLDSVIFNYSGSDNPGSDHIRIRGGEIGGFENVLAPSSHLIIEGIVGANNRWRTDQGTSVLGLEDVDHVLIADSVLRANVAGEQDAGNVLITTAENMVVANVNAQSRENGGVNDWVLRFGSEDTGIAVVGGWLLAGGNFVSRGALGISRVGLTDYPLVMMNVTDMGNAFQTNEGGRGFTANATVVLEPIGVIDPNGGFPALEVVHRNIAWHVQEPSDLDVASLGGREGGCSSTPCEVCMAVPDGAGGQMCSTGATFSYSGAGVVPPLPDPPIIHSAALLEVNDIVGEDWYPEGQPRATFDGVSVAVHDPRQLDPS